MAKRKTFNEIMSDVQTTPSQEPTPAFNSGEAFKGPDGTIYRHIRYLEIDEANCLLASGAQMVIDECGSLGYMGGLEWPDKSDPRGLAVPPIKKPKKGARPFASVEEWEGTNGQRVVVVTGPDFKW